MEKEKKIGLFGGAFSPPTKAHLEIARYVLEHKIVDEVWILPCGVHRFKNDEIPAYNIRKMWCQKASQEYSHIIVNDLDKDRDGKTYFLLDEICKQFPENEFYWLIGEDNARNVNTWHNGEKLIEKFWFIIFPRGKTVKASFLFPKVWYHKRPHLYLKKFPLIDISSTYVRDKIKSGKKEEWEDLVPSTILESVQKFFL